MLVRIKKGFFEKLWITEKGLSASRACPGRARCRTGCGRLSGARLHGRRGHDWSCVHSLTEGRTLVRCIGMRTALILNDEVISVAKRRAAERRTTLSAIVDEALRTTLMSGSVVRRATRFHMPVFRGEGGLVDVSPPDLSRLADEDDFKPYTG